MQAEQNSIAEEAHNANPNGTPSLPRKPAVLIIGGLGYIGRSLALHIHKNDLASEFRIVDKQLPELAYLAPEFKEACSRDKFMQADASREQSLTRIFTPSNPSIPQYDIVFNCGGETHLSQPDNTYRLRSHALSLLLAHECARRSTPTYIELSTGHVYKPSHTPSAETSKLKPWHKLAKWKLQAEHDLAKIEGLNLVILRLANVYGEYETRFLGTAVAMARVYKEEGGEMRWLWDEGMRVAMVHVEDVVRACWRAGVWGRSEMRRLGRVVRPVPVFNVVDHGETSQGTLSTLLSAHFKIKSTFAGTLASSFARLNFASVVDDVNEDTLDAWAELLARTNTSTSPLSPFMDKEALLDKELCMDGGEFERRTGFRYEREKIGEKELREVVESYVRMGWWPGEKEDVSLS